MKAAKRPNSLLKATRAGSLSPSGSGHPMSRQEVADICNRIIDDLCAQEGRSSRWAGMTVAVVGALERGEVHWTNNDYRYALRTLFGKSDTELGFYIDRPQPSLGPDRSTSVPGQQSWTALMPPDGQLDWSANSEVGIVANVGPETRRILAAALEEVRSQPDISAVEVFRQRLNRAKADDGALGPAAVLPVVQGILAAISHHVLRVEAEERRHLLSLGADGAEFAGWLYRDLLDPARARYWYDRAMEWAQEADDTPMQAYVLLRKSQMAYDIGDRSRVVTLAGAAARESRRLPLRVRAEVTQQVALGMAVTDGSLSDIERVMEQSRNLLLSAQPGDADGGPAGAALTIDTLLLRHATCYTVAGKPARAAALFDDVIAKGGLSQRDAGFFQARRAAALALSGEPDEAAALGIDAVQVAEQTSSARTRHVLTNVVRALTPWHSRPGPQAFIDALATSASRSSH